MQKEQILKRYSRFSKTLKAAITFYQAGPVLSRRSTNLIQSQHGSPRCTLATLKTKDKHTKRGQNIQRKTKIGDVIK